MKSIDPSEIQKIQEFYNAGNSIRDCTKEFGRCGRTLKKYLVKRTQVEGSTLKNKSRAKAENMVVWRKRMKFRLIEYKGGKCMCCGYDRCTRALQFHHINPAEKDFQISGTSRSFELLKKEVDKCALVCSNCHAEIHDGIRIIVP